VAQKFHFAILRIEVTRALRGLSAIAVLLVCMTSTFSHSTQSSFVFVSIADSDSKTGTSNKSTLYTLRLLAETKVKLKSV